MKSSHSVNNTTVYVILFATFLGVCVALVNSLIIGNSLKASMVAPAYSLAIGLAIIGVNCTINSMFSKPPGIILYLYAIYVVAGIMTYSLVAKLLAMIISTMTFQLRPNHLLIAVGMSLLVGGFSRVLKFNSVHSNLSQPKRSRDFISVRLRNTIKLINFEEIQYLVAKDKYVSIQANNQEFISSQTISGLIKELPEYFIQIQRGTILNRKYIQEINKLQRGIYSFQLPNGKEFRSGNTYKHRLKELIEN